MFKFIKKDNSINAFVSGKFVLLEEVEDKVFSQKMMGDGFAIDPTDEKIYAPVDGEITVVFPTLHAYGIKTSSNKEVLLHLGIDTVELDGKGFESFVKVGDKVKKGDLIAKLNLDLIKNHNFSAVSMCIITSGETLSFEKISEEVNKDTKIASIN